MSLDEKDEETLKDLGRTVVETPRPRAGRRYAAAVLRTEQSVDEFRTSLEQVVEAAERELPRGELDVEAAIEQLRALEDEVRARWLPAMTLSERGREIALLVPDRDARAEAVSLFDRMIGAVTGALEAVRDCRWQLLALRAKAENEKGEIVTNADDLLQHLHRS